MYTHDTIDQLQLAFYSGLNIVFETLWERGLWINRHTQTTLIMS